MRREQAQKYLNKKVKIVLLSGHNYSGIVQEIQDDHLIMQDKFNETVLIYYTSVSVVCGGGGFDEK